VDEVAASQRDGAYDADQFVDELVGFGIGVRRDGIAPAGLPVPAEAQRLCVDRTQVLVYEFDDPSQRRSISATISRDGSHVANSIVEWIGPPRFFARGRILVLTLNDNATLLANLRKILGPTLSPEARARRALASQHCELRRAAP
jgi:hypothetical protein